MFEPTMRLEAKIEKLENLLSRISQSGTISLESADELERLAPGAIRNIDPEFTFDVDESEHGVGIALEAGYDSLSKVKIAFIVAIVAFIARYIMKLTGKSKGFSAGGGGGGGGGGGWNGKAAPTFETDKPATSIECHEEITTYEEEVTEDIKALRGEFQDLLDKFDTKIISSNLVSGMTKDHDLARLVNVILPRILVDNGATGVSKEGFNHLFAKENKSVKVEPGNYKVFLPENIKDKSVASEAQIAKLKTMLSILNQNYTLEKIFSSDPEIRKTGLMFFMLDKDLYPRGVEFLKLVTKTVSNIEQSEYILRELDDAVSYRGEITDLTPYPQYLKKIWEWVGKHLNKDGEGSSPIRNFIEELDKIIPPKGGIDGAYFNTKVRARNAKEFVNKIISGDSEERTEENSHEVIATYLSGHSSSKELMSLLSKSLEYFDTLGKEIADNSDNLEKFNQHVQRLSEGTIRAMQYAEKDVGIEEVEKPLAEVPEDKMYRGNHYRIYSLITELIQLYLTVIGAGAKMNVEIERLTTNRVKFVVSKCQEIATEYYHLNNALKAIISNA